MAKRGILTSMLKSCAMGRQENAMQRTLFQGEDSAETACCKVAFVH